VLILPWHREGHLPLEIKMVLAAYGNGAFDPAWCHCKTSIDIPAFELERFRDQCTTRSLCRPHIREPWQVPIFDRGQLRCPPRRVARFANHGKNRLAPE